MKKLQRMPNTIVSTSKQCFDNVKADIFTHGLLNI